MENAGAVTFLEDYVFRSRVTDFSREARGETILHEMAHMWFGDLVTMRWWDDLWLNESFATWAGTEAQAEATRWRHSWTTFTTRVEGVGLQAGPAAVHAPDRRRHPGHPRGRGQLRRHHLRQGRRGAQAARRLRRATTTSWPACARYFAAHSYGNATLADLLSALEEVSGRDLGAWSREWLETAGVNTLRPSYTVDDGGRFTAFSVLQSAAPSHPDAALAPDRDRALLAGRTARWSARRPSRPTSPATGRRCPSSSACRGPTWC